MPRHSGCQQDHHGPAIPAGRESLTPKSSSSRFNESIHVAIDSIDNIQNNHKNRNRNNDVNKNQQVKLPKMQKSFKRIATVLQDLYWSIGGMRSELIDGDAGLEAVRAAQR